MTTARTAVDFGLVVLIWLVQLIIYPSFQYMSADQLAVWHPKYANLITLIVGPLMLAQVGLVGWEVLNRFSWLAVASAGLVGLMWASTAFQAVPIHNAIAAGDASSETLARLVSVNWVRTVGWAAIFGLGLMAIQPLLMPIIWISERNAPYCGCNTDKFRLTRMALSALPPNTAIYAPYTVIDKSRQGMLRAEADQVAGLAGLTDLEMARILNMSDRNLHRIKPGERLSRDASERLLLLTNLLRHGLDVFDDDAGTLADWLRSPIRELNSQSPLHLLDTTTGFGLVDDVLGRIEHGIVG